MGRCVSQGTWVGLGGVGGRYGLKAFKCEEIRAIQALLGAQHQITGDWRLFLCFP